MSKKDEAIKLKIEKANAFMSEVDVLIENKFFTTAISRLYYGCFHITKALLLTKGLIPKTHTGVATMLHQHFVQTGLFEGAQAMFFSRLMQERMVDDYSDFMIDNQDHVLKYLLPAKNYFQLHQEPD